MTNEELTIEVGKKITELLKESIFEIDGTPKLTVKREDGNPPYSKKAMISGAEFMLTDTYMGSREGLILCFSPVDAQPFTVEIPAKKVDDVFQNFGFELAQALEPEAQTVAVEDTMTIINQMVGRLRKQKLAEAEEAEEREKNRVANAYDGNPLFGMF
jgi:hypothetical protein